VAICFALALYACFVWGVAGAFACDKGQAAPAG
jgi:hypothetical protein